MSSPLTLAIVNFNKGSYIIVEGKENADRFYIIRSGNVRISKEVEIVAEEQGNTYTPGDFFGVVSTMSSHSHIESALALTDVTLISVERDQYGLLIEKNAPVAMKIIQSFSRKMRYLDEALTELTFKSTSKDDPSHLFNVAEYYARQKQYNQAYYAYYKYIQHCPKGEHLDTSKERMAKIHPYAKAVHLEKSTVEFTRTYPQNTMIFSESEPGNELYIIHQGRVKISKIVNNNEVLLAVFKKGDIFGEMAILENKPRSASAIAYDDVVLLAVNKANFAKMIQEQPQLVTRLTQLLADRIWFLYKQLANCAMGVPIGRLYDGLLIQLEKNRVPVMEGKSYTFDFGTKELINLVGLPVEQGNGAVRELLQNRHIKLLENKIYVSDIEEIRRQTEYYRKMEKIERSRREGSALKSK